MRWCCNVLVYGGDPHKMARSIAHTLIAIQPADFAALPTVLRYWELRKKRQQQAHGGGQAEAKVVEHSKGDDRSQSGSFCESDMDKMPLSMSENSRCAPLLLQLHTRMGEQRHLSLSLGCTP